MLQFLALLTLAAFGGESDAIASAVDTGSSISVATPTGTRDVSLEDGKPFDHGPRADPSTQMLYSTLWSGLGIVGGVYAGGAIGVSLSSNSDGWGALADMVYGMGIGALVGGTTGATWGAYLARPKRRYRSVVPTALGGFGGLVLGFAAGIATFNVLGSDNSAVTALSFLAIPALGAGAGATLVDQWTTPRRISGLPSNPKLGLAPWMPREGLVGLRVSLPAGI